MATVGVFVADGLLLMDVLLLGCPAMLRLWLWKWSVVFGLPYAGP